MKFHFFKNTVFCEQFAASIKSESIPCCNAEPLQVAMLSHAAYIIIFSTSIKAADAKYKPQYLPRIHINTTKDCSKNRMPQSQTFHSKYAPR